MCCPVTMKHWLFQYSVLRWFLFVFIHSQGDLSKAFLYVANFQSCIFDIPSNWSEDPNLLPCYTPTYTYLLLLPTFSYFLSILLYLKQLGGLLTQGFCFLLWFKCYSGSNKTVLSLPFTSFVNIALSEIKNITFFLHPSPSPLVHFIFFIAQISN